MNEEIIIDGVKVSECEDFAEIHKQLMSNGNVKEIEHYCYSAYDECGGKDCYFKQLKRLEQKYNEVLKLAKQNADSNECVIQELEVQLEPFNDEYFLGLSSGQIAELAKKSIRLTTYNRELEKENEILKQALDKEPLAQKALVMAYSSYKKQVNELNEVLDKYCSALEEIRDMVRGHKVADETRLQVINGLINKVLESEEE